MAEISFVRHYKMYREDFFDVLYKTNRMYTFTLENLPSTVDKFMETHEGKKHNDKFYGEEYIYK